MGDEAGNVSSSDDGDGLEVVGLGLLRRQAGACREQEDECGENRMDSAWKGHGGLLLIEGEVRVTPGSRRARVWKFLIENRETTGSNRDFLLVSPAAKLYRQLP
jgi:hypothetical protein